LFLRIKETTQFPPGIYVFVITPYPATHFEGKTKPLNIIKVGKKECFTETHDLTSAKICAAEDGLL